MEFDRVEIIEQEWIKEGKIRDRDYVWLAHGKYMRYNPNFELETPFTQKKPPSGGFNEVRKVISQFYNTYIIRKKNFISLDQCCVTGGCKDGVNASLLYFKSKDRKNVLYLVPTFQPLIQIGESIFHKSKLFFLKHFNEPWYVTLQNIKHIIERSNVGCIVLTNPNNPAGIMYPHKFLKELSNLCNNNEIWIIEDGAYFLHYHKKRQTSILEHAQYAISLITSYKLLLGKHRVGGAVLTDTLDAIRFSEYTKKVFPEQQLWFGNLMIKVALENPQILRKHLYDIFDVSKKVKNLFIKAGFIPLFGFFQGSTYKTSIGPVISFTYKNKDNKNVDSEELFEILKDHDVLVTPLNDGIRINSRGITQEGIELLWEKLKKIRRELKEKYH